MLAKALQPFQRSSQAGSAGTAEAVAEEVEAANVCHWPFSAAPIIRPGVRYVTSSCRARSVVGEAVHDPERKSGSDRCKARSVRFAFLILIHR